MQVGLNTTSLSAGGALNPSVGQHAVAKNAPVRQKPSAVASDYPASPLIATRPQRYSVQLNDQITTLQQADGYLAQLEQQLMNYRHVAHRGGQGAQQNARDITRMLELRVALAGQSVDRQLKPVLQGEARVMFHAPALAERMQNPSSGACMFSVSDGRRTLLSAVSVGDEVDAGQYNVMMGNALRRVGIQVHARQGSVTFSSAETSWPHIAQTLSVHEEGARPSAFTPLTTFPEPSLADDVLQSVRQGTTRAGDSLQKALDTIGEQRAQMAVQQEKARQLIDNMARFPQADSAIQASTTLGGVLDNANHNYHILAQAVKGQARISGQTVRSLLR
ncbi:flagellar hook-associated protein [unidentified bacterial endosymbiont]|uniref:flagellar hook-associated protein n=1 Tax=unidentified bacterial endosymbiont TaxID=2355 RepID=UPI00209E6E5D|nr:flagellar hook-associated protein [unidentified bacterial endosymbiont]